MLKKAIALWTILAVLTTGFALAPAALASEYYSARTPITDSGAARRTNVDLALNAINGTVVPYGGSFSFNATVGPRSADRGFATAPNGRGVPVTGGGVAQVASTLYLALLQVRGDVRIDPVRTYGNRFVDSYVTDSSQAVVTDYDAGIDLSFTNYADVMSIDMWANDSYVYCSITVGSEDAAATADTDGGASTGDGWFIFPVQTAAPARRLVASSSLNCGGDANVLNNVALASDCVTDTVLGSGDLFSFNDIVGPRQKKYGSVRATNGRGAQVVGGGVAQVASALWLAIKDSGSFAIVEKSTYGKRYNQRYVSSSSDAILTDYNSGRDFSFRYTGAGSVTIYTSVSGGELSCEIYAN